MSDGNREWRKIIDYAKRIGAFVNKIPLKSHHSFDLFDTTSAQELKLINYGECFHLSINQIRYNCNGNINS